MNTLDYGVIGNCRTAALISKNGSIDWCCIPEFDSSSIFAKILDVKKGGSFEIITDKNYVITQKYIANTNILSTQFTDGNNCFRIYDFMPRYRFDDVLYTPPDIIRYFEYVSGTPKFKIVYNPKLEYAEHQSVNKEHDAYIKTHTTQGTYDSLYLYTDFNKSDILNQNEIVLQKDSFCLISYHQKLLQQNIERQYLKLQRTKVYWLNWTNKLTKYAEYNSEITRSALALKMLSYDKTGAILAALTTSLPETIGEVRNWDYRFCWIRDASMVIKVMTSLDHYNLAHDYLRFIIDLLPEKDERIQIMYGINGEKKLTEETLDHLSGYCNSAPVRIGNAAYKQKQNDIYGILMDVIYQHFQLFSVTLEHSEELWTITRNMVRTVSRNWKRPDKGIWEMRQNDSHFTFSKVLCWVAVDRAIKIASLLQQRDQAEAWMPLRDEIKQDILTKAWNEEKQAFTQAYGVDDLDASVLQMEFYGFLPGKDPQFVSTVKAIQKELGHKGLMFRYRNKDDFGEPSSAFTICSFWLVRALYMIGEEEEARKKFDQLLSHSNHLGLFSEDLDFETKRLLGNFPQAYSHLALIDTAMHLPGGKLSKEELLLQIIH